MHQGIPQGGTPQGGSDRPEADSLPHVEAAPRFAHEWVAHHALHRPEATAVVHGLARLSYGELNQRAYRVARRLQAVGVGPESRVGLFVERSVDMIVGLLGILQAGGAYVPLDLTLPAARLSFLIADAGIATFVTQRALAERLPGPPATHLFLDEEAAEARSKRAGPRANKTEGAPKASALGAENLAYVIYTSGSTGVPKGVMVEHRGLSNLARASLTLLGVSPDSRVLQFASLGFDASVYEIFMAFAAGASLHIPTREVDLPGPALVRFLRDEAITHATFLPSTLAALPFTELPALAVLTSAGEVLSEQLCARWGAGRRLLNAYGPTEATVWASLHVCQPGESAPPIGHALPGVELRLVGSDLAAVADGEVGELCILGAGVARGYLNRPELSAQRFVSDPTVPGQRLYRTGDLARRLSDGQLAFIGRIDQQVKIRGFRVEPGEIEVALARHPAVLEAVVVAREDAPGERRLCAYLILQPGASATPGSLRALLREQLPEHMIPGAFVLMAELPRSSSGKVDRRALPAPGHARPALDTAYEPPSSESERALASIWSEVLRIATVGRHDDFFELGGDSLSAVQILSRTREQLGVELAMRTVFEARTVAALARSLSSLGAPVQADAHVSPLRAAEFCSRAEPRAAEFCSRAEPRAAEFCSRAEPRAAEFCSRAEPRAAEFCSRAELRAAEFCSRAEPRAAEFCSRAEPRASTGQLSFAQQGLWFLHALDPESVAYHLAALLRISGPFDRDALAAALTRLALRHEPLRTTFPSRDGLPVPMLAPADTVSFVSTDDLSTLPAALRAQKLEAIRAEEVKRPFDLAVGPLFRARLVRLDREQHVLLLTAHHIIADGLSMAVLLRELCALYDAHANGASLALPELPLSFADFAHVQRQRLSGASLERELAFWRRELAGAPRELGLISDRPRPSINSFRGAQAAFELGPGEHQALKRLCRSEGASLFMALLAGFALQLRRQGAGPDLVIGTPVAGRSLPDVEGLIGHFANTIPLRTRVPDGAEFRDFLRQVRERALAAYAHQELPFDRLVAELQPERSQHFQPLVQAILSLQPPPRSTASAGGTTFELELLQGEGAPFDLALTVWELPRGGLGGVLVYSSDLFEPSSARSLLDGYAELLRRAAADPSLRVAALLSCGADPERALTRPSAMLDDLAAALLSEPGVDDCAVRLRATEGGEPEVVAYLVGHAAGTHGRNSALGPLHQVPIAAMPLTPEGLVDEDALRRFEVVDSELARRWVAQLTARPEVLEAAAIIRERPWPARRLHVDDLLPKSAPSQARQTPRARLVEGASAAVEALRPALADGGPLHIPQDAPRTLPELLLRSAAAGQRGIHHAHRDRSTSFQSYASLRDQALGLLAGLNRVGLRPGDRAILAIDAFARQFEALWGCLLGGIVPAQVAPTQDASFSKLESAWRLLGCPVILASRSNAPTLRELPFRPRVLATEDLEGAAAEACIHEAKPSDVAFFQLTSGSTGAPKCIQETHQAILRHIHSAIASNGYGPRDTTFNWIPLDHVVPILMCHLKDVFVGCDQIHARTEHFVADPLLWPDLVEAYGVTHTWCPNFGFKLIGAAIAGAPGRTWDLSSIVRFLNAGEQVTLAVSEEFLRITAPFGFNPDAIQPAYGMAEVASVMTYGGSPRQPGGVNHVATSSLAGRLERVAPAASEDGASVAFVSVGPPVAGVRIRIVDADNRVVPEQTIGRLQIQGGVVTPGYLDNDAENQRAFVADGWFDTGDLGFLIDGQLTVTGREKDTIIVRGVNVYCHEVEDVVNGISGVEPTFAAACGVDDADQGTEALAIFFVPQEAGLEAAARLAETIRRVLTERLGLRPALVVPLPKAEFPKTTSGKIQRSQLKRALGEGAFQAVLRALDLHAASERTLADAFHRHTWRRKEAVIERAPEAGACLIIADSQGMGESLAAALTTRGQRVVSVQWGAAFARLGEHAYSVQAHESADYARLLREIAEPVRAIVHLAGYGAESDGADSLLALVRALFGSCAEARASTPARARQAVRLLMVSSGAQATRLEEPVSWLKTAAVALLRTLSEELPELDARHLDLPLLPAAESAAYVLRELCVLQLDREVAYRAGQRLVACLAPVDLTCEQAGPLPFEQGGAYLITGGLGGIGQVIARYLLRHYRARLLLVGRTQLSPEAPERAAAQRELSSLAQRCGGELLYEPSDIADSAALASVVAGVEQRWGRAFDGFIHLAGSLEERLLTDESREGLAAAMRPKLCGAVALGQLLSTRPQALFIAASSANAFLGGFSVGAYAAANRAMVGFVHELRRQGRTRSHCIAWSAWDELGMNRARSMKDAARAKGYRSLTPDEGLNSLLAAITRAPEHLIAGLERGHPQIERHGAGRAGSRRELCVLYTTTDAASELTEPPTVRDRFGLESQATLWRVDSIPRSKRGEVDATSLDLGSREAPRRRPYVAPADETEHALLAIWRELLSSEGIGVDDNFFDLGGHSLLLTQVRGRLHAVFGRDVPLVDLFRHPSIRALGSYLRSEREVSTVPLMVRERGQSQRLANARQRPVQRPALSRDVDDSSVES